MKFDFDPKQFSKQKYLIGGIDVYVYNSDVLEQYIKDHESKATTTTEKIDQIPINVMYLIHGRGEDYKSTESAANYTLSKVYSGRKLEVPLICVAFDSRNHGSRLVNKKNNGAWSEGNDTHALDMLSSIEGTIADLKLVMDYLPGYLNLEHFLSPRTKKIHGTKIIHKNILSGYSMGGHTIIRFANLYPDSVDILNPVIGCPDLTSLFITRLCKEPVGSDAFYKKWYYYDYDELNLPEEIRYNNYPEQLHNRISEQDKAIFENFPFKKIKLFAAFGEKDKLVPPLLSDLWIQLYNNSNFDTEEFTQPDVGHDVTTEMLDKFANYLLKHLV